VRDLTALGRQALCAPVGELTGSVKNLPDKPASCDCIDSVDPESAVLIAVREIHFQFFCIVVTYCKAVVDWLDPLTGVTVKSDESRQLLQLPFPPLFDSRSM